MTATLSPHSISSTTPLPRFRSHAPLRTLHPPMAILGRLNLLQRRYRRLFSVAAAAVRRDTTVWTSAPLSGVHPAAEELFHITIDISDSPDLATSYTRAGQYLQLRLPDVEKPSFLAIASPPALATARGEFEFLVKSVSGSTAELLCGLRKGDTVELSQVMGNGFDLDQISPAEEYPTVLIFATGSGIRRVFWPRQFISFHLKFHE